MAPSLDWSFRYHIVAKKSPPAPAGCQTYSFEVYSRLSAMYDASSRYEQAHPPHRIPVPFWNPSHASYKQKKTSVGDSKNTQLHLYPAQGQNAAMPLIMQRLCALTTRNQCRTPRNQSPVWPFKGAAPWKIQSKICRPLEDESPM